MENTNSQSIDITITVSPEMLDNLNEIAELQNTDTQALTVGYIAEGMKPALPKVKHKKFIRHTKEVLGKHHVPHEAIEEIVDKFTF